MKIRNLIAVAALALGTAVVAHADPLLNGSVSLGGLDTFTTPPAGTVVSFSSGTVFGGTDDFAGVTGSVLPTSFNYMTGFSSPIVFVTGPNGLEIELDNVTSAVTSGSGNTLTIEGVATFDLTGFAPTIGSYVITSSNTGDSTAFEATAGVTPEPESLALFGTGLLGIVGIARRRFNV